MVMRKERRDRKQQAPQKTSLISLRKVINGGVELSVGKADWMVTGKGQYLTAGSCDTGNKYKAWDWVAGNVIN